ncbi:energy transducer TonB, partial [Arsukibacterium sp.]|uniref:energy transducer TonB n=1 Tax=Arsukibacterium sp. TaxID=1977258 RepID=UPI002FDA7C74
VTFSLFVMMYMLIKPQLTERPPVVERAVVELYKNSEDSATVVKTMPEPPPPIVQPDPLPRTTVEITNITTPGTVFNVPSPQITTTQGSFNAGVDKSATPVVRVEPRFPMDALRNGISGWVKLSFTIDETGGVTDVEVVQAEPRGVFDREAVRALRRWKYQPQVLDGKAIRQSNLQVVLDFTLDAG